MIYTIYYQLGSENTCIVFGNRSNDSVLFLWLVIGHVIYEGRVPLLS